jgi:DNA primase
MERAKKLMEAVESGGSFREMSDSLKEDTRAAKIQEYGESKLPCGEINGDELIVVEGRADVVNLLKNRVNNVIGMNGTKLPAEIAELGERKEITLFVDGDRGGKLIAQNVINNAKIVYVAVAPDGKEVEELVGKEIIIALRRRMPVSEYVSRERINLNANTSSTATVLEPTFTGDVKEKLKKVYEDSVRNSKSAALLDTGLDIIRRVSSRDVPKAVRGTRTKVFAIVLDGTVTAAAVKACEEEGVAYLAATNFGYTGDTRVKLISL